MSSDTNQVISNAVCKCIRERCHSMTSTDAKQAANHPRFAAAGLAAAQPPCPGLLRELGEEGSTKAVARGRRAAHPHGDGHTKLGELPSPRRHALAESLHVPGFKGAVKSKKSLSFVTSLCHISTIFDNRKASRRIAELFHWRHCLRRLE